MSDVWLIRDDSLVIRFGNLLLKEGILQGPDIEPVPGLPATPSFVPEQGGRRREMTAESIWNGARLGRAIRIR